MRNGQYMATLAKLGCNGQMNTSLPELHQQGKPFDVATVACRNRTSASMIRRLKLLWAASHQLAVLLMQTTVHFGNNTMSPSIVSRCFHLDIERMHSSQE